MTNEKSDRRTGGIERRSFLKSATVTAAAGTGIVVGAGSSTANRLSPEDSAEKPDFAYKKVDKSVKDVTAHYTLLTFSEDTILSNINDSNASQKEKREARETVLDLRSDFPVREKRDGNVIWLTLAKDKASTKEDREKFQQVHTVYRDGIGSDVSTDWYTSDHSDHTRAACYDVDVPDDDRDTIEKYSEEPDNVTDGVSLPDEFNHVKDLEEAFEYGLKKFSRHWDHYYDTYFYESYWCYHDGHGEDVYGIGGAPDATDDHMGWADYYDYYDYDWYRDKYLGMALHFLQDVANPLHAGMGWEQLGIYLYYDSSEDDYVDWGVDINHATHDRYEEYASDNWIFDDGFYYDFRSFDDCCYYDIYDRADAVKGMSDKAGEYSYDVYDTILNEEDNAHWENWSSSTRDKMRDLTAYLMKEEGKYVRGFLKEYF